MDKKYTAKELSKLVRQYAKEDGCVHFILEEADGTISQTCDVWLDCDIEEYVAKNNMKILEVIEP